jgi:hypothetical protein
VNPLRLRARARRVAAVVLRQLYLLRGSPARILPLFAWVAVDVVLWGFITRYLDAVVPARLGLATALLGAVLLWDFMGRVIHGVAMAFLEDVWSRNFLNVFASPITVGEYAAGLVATSVLTSAVGPGAAGQPSSAAGGTPSAPATRRRVSRRGSWEPDSRRAKLERAMPAASATAAALRPAARRSALMRSPTVSAPRVSAAR